MYNEQVIEIIEQMHKDGKSNGEIGKVLHIDRSTIRRILNRPKDRQKGKTGPKPLIGPREITKIKRTVRERQSSKARTTSRIVQSELGLGHVSIRTMQRALKLCRFDYQPATKLIQLSAAHKRARLAAARKWIAENHQWDITVFTDEKRFSMDGPDSWSSYTDEGRPVQLNKRQNNGGGIMVWGALLPPNFLYLLRIDGKFNSAAFCAEILNQAVPFIDDMFGVGNWILQQDNCSIHASAETRAHLSRLQVRTFEWPARSPDLNIIENVWSMMVEIVYKEKAQYKTKDELWQAIEEAVIKINTELASDIKKLYDSVRKRHIAVIEKRGDKID